MPLSNPGSRTSGLSSSRGVTAARSGSSPGGYTALATLIAALLFSCVGYAAGGSPSGLQVEDGWIRAMPPGQPVTAAFMVLVNRGEHQLSVVAMHSERASRVELHRTVALGERVRMEAVAELEIPAGDRVVLAPGGLHLMLFGLDEERLEAGASIPLELILSDGARIAISLPVVDERHRGDTHQHHH